MKDLRPKIRKGNPIRVALSIFDVYDSVGECRDARFCVSTYANQFIHLTTVTRCVLTPFSVAMRTMYTPALNWAMLMICSSPSTSRS